MATIASIYEFRPEPTDSLFSLNLVAAGGNAIEVPEYCGMMPLYAAKPVLDEDEDEDDEDDDLEDDDEDDDLEDDDDDLDDEDDDEELEDDDDEDDADEDEEELEDDDPKPLKVKSRG